MVDRPKFEDIVAGLREGQYDSDEAADLLEQHYGKAKLREEAGRAAELERQLNEANQRIGSLERAPQREAAFREYGVDVDVLRPAERKALETYDGELDREKIAAFVDELDLPLVDNGEIESTEEQPAARGIVATAQRAPAAQRRTGFVITPEDAQAWTVDQQWRWDQENPGRLAELMQGRTVTGIAPPT